MSITSNDSQTDDEEASRNTAESTIVAHLQHYEPCDERNHPDLGKDYRGKDSEDAATTSSHTMSLPQSCSICVEDFVKGDILACSYNKECAHVFHHKCLVPWLMMDHDECPMCRSIFLSFADEETTESRNNSVEGEC